MSKVIGKVIKLNPKAQARLNKARGFKWNKFVVATTQKVLDEAIIGHIIYGGNFFMELVLPNALKINWFDKLKVRLDKYIKSHGGKLPSQITCTRKQLTQYESLFPNPETRIWGHKGWLTFQGIPIITHNAKPRTKSRRLLNT